MSDLFLLASFLVIALLLVGFNAMRHRADVSEPEAEQERRRIEAQVRDDVIAITKWYRSIRPATEEPDTRRIEAS